MKTLKFNSITAKKVKKFAVEPTNIDDSIEAVNKRRLVVAWDNPKNEEDSPNYWLGFLSAVTFNGQSPRYSVRPANTASNFSGSVEFDKVAVIADEDCPKVFFNNGVCQSVGYLVSAEPTTDGSDWCCSIRVAPFRTECRYNSALASACTEVETIQLGISHVE